MNQTLVFWLSFLIPGSGHLAIKRYKAAALGLAYTALSWLAIVTQILPNISKAFVYHTGGDYEGAYTIGVSALDRIKNPINYDDSFIVLVSAVFCVFVLIAFLLVNYGFARDAKNVRKAQLEGEEVLTLKEKAAVLAPEIVPQAIASPAFALIFLFIIIPAAVSILIAFTNYKTPIVPPAFLIEWRGLENFTDLINDPRLSSAFTDTLGWTLTWTFSATLLVLSLGTFLAVLSNNKKIKGKKFFRTVYLLPWAVPAFLTILIFQIFFSKLGTMNTIVIPFFTGSEYTGVADAIGFLTDANIARVVIILVQGWLGFPYIYVLVTGILQTIPHDLYEAANMDGGNPWSNFWDITFPIIIASAAPTFITQFTFNFNNVMIIYLLGQNVVKEVGSLYSPIETIASLGYQLMVDNEYSTAAVFSLLTSVVVSGVVLWSWIKTGAFKKEEVM